ncbi:alpha/beta fold hydrolase [Haloplanus litoreus]
MAGGEIPDATHVPFEESGHCPFWEEPDRFNEEVAAFVDG